MKILILLVCAALYYSAYAQLDEGLKGTEPEPPPKDFPPTDFPSIDLSSTDVPSIDLPAVSNIITFPGRFCSQICLEIFSVDNTDRDLSKYRVTINVSTPGTFVAFNINLNPRYLYSMVSSDNTTEPALVNFPLDGHQKEDFLPHPDIGYLRTFTGRLNTHTTTFVFSSPFFVMDAGPFEQWIDINSVLLISPFMSTPCLNPYMINGSVWSPAPLIPSLLISYTPFVLIQTTPNSTPEKDCLDVGATIICLNNFIPFNIDRNIPCTEDSNITIQLREIMILYILPLSNSVETYQDENWANAAPFDFNLYTTSFKYFFQVDEVPRTVISYALCVIEPPSTNITSSNGTTIISASTIPHPTIINTIPVYSGTFTSTTAEEGSLVSFSMPIPYQGSCSDLLLYKDSIGSPGVFEPYDRCSSSRLAICYSFSSYDQLTCTLAVSVQDNAIGDTDGRLGIVSDAYSVVLTSSSEGMATTVILAITLSILVLAIVVAIIITIIVRITKYKSINYALVPLA